MSDPWLSLFSAEEIEMLRAIQREHAALKCPTVQGASP